MQKSQAQKSEELFGKFIPPVREWFRETFGAPTPPQAQGWPPIQRGENTLILSPTGSGKTLTAFLWGINELYRQQPAGPLESAGKKSRKNSGIRILYISPLKALNNDIERNLRVPLTGIKGKASQLNINLPQIRVAVRSGDTPHKERQAIAKNPPDILITTPESLYLMLSSPRARLIFKTVQTVIVDEIHTLAGNKRGAHLALTLERLQEAADRNVQRIGLSATIRPLEEVARFLGGFDYLQKTSSAEPELQPRPVTIIDAGYKKPLDLQVKTVTEGFRNLPEGSVWPRITMSVLEEIRKHRTSLIFTNNRRLAERLADWLNEQIAAESQGKSSGVTEAGVAKGIGLMGGSGAREGPVRAHHGSISKEARLEIEQKLKSGELTALVGTSSLELGIDIGSVDLVMQIQSPKAAAQGLQRVGRSGHLVGQTSKGRFFPTFREDVLESAAIAGAMLEGNVESTKTPAHPLDVLAQQVVAMVAVQDRNTEELFRLIRRAYPYRNLTYRLYQNVLEMLSGRYPSVSHRELRPRIAWDRVNNRLSALPGSRYLAIRNGGTITDRGAYGAYLGDGKTKIGELDEEFVYETRVGDTFLFGSQVWRVLEITHDRVMVAAAPGAVPRIPFWRGDFPWRPFEMGKKVGSFRRQVAEKMIKLKEKIGLDDFSRIRDYSKHPPVKNLEKWLCENFALDNNSAWQVMEYAGEQLDSSGAISSDRDIIVEVFDDLVGDSRLVVHSPFGGKINGPWGLAIAGAIREKTGQSPELETNDDGILLRISASDSEIPLNIVSDLTPREVQSRILNELPDSALFGAQFRQNAARALMMPGSRGGKRTPFWLQRLKAKDLLHAVRKLEDFPIVAETIRDCLQDVMDLPHLLEILEEIRAGKIKVHFVESVTPSPVAQSLLMDFAGVYMYEWDAPKAEQQLRRLNISHEMLQDVLDEIPFHEILQPEAVEEITAYQQHTTQTGKARSAEELFLLMQQMGDLSGQEIRERCAEPPDSWIAALTRDNRITQISIPGRHGFENRWISGEYKDEYRQAFGELPNSTETANEVRFKILLRFLGHAGPVTQDQILFRYRFPENWLGEILEKLIGEKKYLKGHFSLKPETGNAPEYVERQTFEKMHRKSLAILRNEIKPVLLVQYADFLIRWQHLHPDIRLAGRGKLIKILQQLRAFPLTAQTIERDVLPERLDAYDSEKLANLCSSGELIWYFSGGIDPKTARVGFIFRGEGNVFLPPENPDEAGRSETASKVYRFLKEEGALFYSDIRDGLGLSGSETGESLLQLALDGLITNDSLGALQQIISDGGSVLDENKAESRYSSSLEAELRSRVPRDRKVFRPSASRLHSAKQRVRKKLEKRDSIEWIGRWSALQRYGVMGKHLSLEEQVARQASQLLLRYGIISRESLQQENDSLDWNLLYQHLKLMEMRGEIRRGYFVQGLSGIQFALPEALEKFQFICKSAGSETDETKMVILNACDPANIYAAAKGDSLKFETGEPFTFSRIPSVYLALRNGHPLLVCEGYGKAITAISGTNSSEISSAMGALIKRLGKFQNRLTIEKWNGGNVLNSGIVPVLERLGFYRDYKGMTRDNPSI